MWGDWIMRILIGNLAGMSPLAGWLLRGGLLVSNALMLCAALLLLAAGPKSGITYGFHALSQTMRDTCSAVLFITAFGSALLEERSRKTT